MNIISNYKNIGDDILYSSFTCELDQNTILKFDLDETDCKVTMEDKISGVIDISAHIDIDGIKSLVRTLRVITSQLEKYEKPIGHQRPPVPHFPPKQKMVNHHR